MGRSLCQLAMVESSRFLKMWAQPRLSSSRLELGHEHLSLWCENASLLSQYNLAHEELPFMYQRDQRSLQISSSVSAAGRCGVLQVDNQKQVTRERKDCE